MIFEVDPEPGQWYLLGESEEVFKVIFVDMEELTIRIQWAGGETTEIEFADWEVLDVEETAEPAGWDEAIAAARDGVGVRAEDDDEADALGADEEPDEDEAEEDDWDEDEDDDDLDDDDSDDDDDDWDEEDEGGERDEVDEDDDEDNGTDSGQEGTGGNEWQRLLRSEVDEELARQSRNEQRRAALVERRCKVRAAALEMISGYFDQIGQESGVVVTTDSGPPMSYTVRVQATDDWMERVEIQQGSAEGSWRVVRSSGGVIKKMSELEEYLKGYLTKHLANRLAPLRAEQLRQKRRAAEALERERALVQARERQAAEARERERALEQARERQAAEARERERKLDYEARMLARGRTRSEDKE